MTLMHADTTEAFDQIDAAVFSGDVFMDNNERVKFREMMTRWEKELLNFDELSKRFSEDGTLLDENGNRSIFDDVDK